MFIRKITLLFIGIVLLSFNAFSAEMRGKLVFTAWLTGAEEVPAVNTNAVGVASLQLSENRDSLMIMVMTTGLSGTITGASILESHRGTTGGALQSLELLRAGNKFNGVLTGADLPAGLIAKLLSGDTYINVYTDNNPNGEIRGQLHLEKNYSLHAVLNGMEVSPSVTTDAYGIAAFQLSQDKTKLHIYAIFQDLSSTITGIHLAMATMGNNGPNVLDLKPYLSGNKIDTVLRTGDFTFLDIDSLLENNLYITVETADNPGAEIRGQLHRQYGVDFYASLSGAQEVPKVTTSGKGVGVFELNNNLDTLAYDITFTNLSSEVTAAHLHLGKPGVSGGVILNLSDSISGNRIKGKAYGIDLTKAIVKAMLQGEVYVNVHTKNHPNGEIRGQMISGLRDVYTFDLCGEQQTPIVNTIAQGLAVVSVNRDSANLHYMVVADSLSSNVTGAHFHKAVIGQNGSVVFPITISNNSANGFWADTSTTAFTKQIARDIAAENYYVNIHTSNNPNGEIRGQVVDRAICSEILSIANNTILNASISVYPMPFTDALTINIDAMQNGNYTAKIYDMQGREINFINAYIHSGKNALSIDVQAANKGLYMLQINDEKGRSYSQKIMRY